VGGRVLCTNCAIPAEGTKTVDVIRSAITPEAGIVAYWSWFAFSRSQNEFALEMFSDPFAAQK